MNLLPRMAFRCMEPLRHICIPLFDPACAAEDDFLLVRLTTLRDSQVDDACILHPADYAELTHATTAAYSRALTGKKSAFLRALTAGHFIRLPDLPEMTWRKLIEAAHTSPELSVRQKGLLPSYE
jgi:hypothetical protein